MCIKIQHNFDKYNPVCYNNAVSYTHLDVYKRQVLNGFHVDT